MFKEKVKLIQDKTIELAIKKPKQVMVVGFILTLVFLAAFPNIKTDTDPVNMLDRNNPAVVLHNQLKKEFEVADVVALGIQTKDGKSLFTVNEIKKIELITKEIFEIRDPQNPEEFILENKDIMSLTTIDDIVTNKKGELLVEKLMPTLPTTDSEASTILNRLNSNPMLGGKVNSKDGSLVGIFMPLLEGKKDRSYFLSKEIEKIANKHLGSNEKYYFAGLPVAESTFGNEMFVQMSIYAPMAGLVIFILLLIFFKSWKVVIAPMILSMMAVIWSMGALIYSGNVIHIMSSMIPIFIMPIAVLDSVHILSTLSEKIGLGQSKEDAITGVIKDLFNPMFYTSLTTVVGFFSLITTGIPPVMVFGVTIAFGVAISFLLTIIFIPAYTMFLSDKTLKKFGNKPSNKSPINTMARFFEKFSWKAPKIILASSFILIAISLIGVNKIIINDNPVRWFKKAHPLRIADVEMNKALAGTYMTNLYFSFPKTVVVESEDDFAEDSVDVITTIKNPTVIAYMEKIGDFLQTLKDKNDKPFIGGVTSIVDVLKKIGTVAFQSDTLPKTQKEISQYMFLYESGDVKRGRDMWKLITNGDSQSAQMWVHFKSGDNQNMIDVQAALAKYISENPAPSIVNLEGVNTPLKVEWSGLMHINKVWQEAMVSGMRDALIGSFIIVFFMMIFLFKSVKWSIIAMLPLSLTIAFIYGMIGFTGKFYDMPIAVLSSLTLGLSIDFAIHFIEHARSYNKKYKDYAKTFDVLFKGTAQAIWRNVMVISIGFTPLLFADLVPYKTVGTFFLLIMLISGVTTLLLLPAILKLFHKSLPGFEAEGPCTLELDKALDTE
jgi:predicted RND superfamily exporter protein